MKSKKILIIALVMAMMFMLSGCIQMVLELDIKEDMSADFDMKIGILSEYSDLMGDIWEEYEDVEKLGYTIAQYETDGYTGMEITGKVKDITKKNDISDNFLSDGQDAFISYQEEGSNRIVKLSLPVSSFYGDSAEDETGMSLEEMNAYAKTDIRLVVTFPFDVVEHNATSVSGRTLTWDISKMTDDTMYAVAEGKAGSVGSKLVKGLLLGLGALAIAAIVILVLSKAGKKKQANNVAGANQTADANVYNYNYSAGNNDAGNTADWNAGNRVYDYSVNSETNANQNIDTTDYDNVNAETTDDNPFEG